MRKQVVPALASDSIRRCAIYTRKSSEEGLDQAFNSLDAQREACGAYILSQRHEGWKALPTLYDDGGISGGTLERPALQQLLADIRSGKVSLVVVYKVDRLTRSLADFAKIVEVFDTHGASFVSVTQQFNTTTSMGRLTLNMLLSFAQFEREVTGERIRDKIAASKRKGMWMGGTVPLGYEVRDRKLVIHPEEAETVRTIFQIYLELGSVQSLQDQLTQRGIRTKHKSVAPASMSRGALYLTLQNRLYRGEVQHKGQFFPGEHAAIIDAELWEAVQQRLAGNRNERRAGTRSAHPSLLAGLLFDEQGERLVPTHATKDHRRYRYYISQELQTSRGAEGLRIPAGDVEQIVTDRLLQFISQHSEVFAAINSCVADGAEQQRMLERASYLASTWSAQPAGDQRAMLRRVIARIVMGPATADLHLSPAGLTALLRPAAATAAETLSDPLPIILSAPVQRTRWKKEVRLLIRGAAGETKPNPALIRLLVKAHHLWDRLLRDNLTITAVAEQEGVTGSYVTRLVRFACLAPDLATTILNGQQPPSMTAETLLRHSRLPLAWAEQRRLLGFT